MCICVKLFAELFTTAKTKHSLPAIRDTVVTNLVKIYS